MANRNGAQRASLKVDRHSYVAPAVKISSFKPKPSLRRSDSTSFSGAPNKVRDGVPGRVRVAVRLRPRTSEELVVDADFADCVELQPELKRLKLRKNNWDSDTYEFDEVLAESASQKRVYEVVAKPVVESVLAGYNGTVMAYGQTGTGKTFTLGRLGEEDTSDRGIMVRAMEDILADISLENDSISLSYMQVLQLRETHRVAANTKLNTESSRSHGIFMLYMETLQDLLDPSNDNISIVEDPKTGDVSLPGATVLEIRDQHSCLELLQLGETHRVAANTKLNTESSRSHGILMVYVKRSVVGNEDGLLNEDGESSQLVKPFRPIVRKSKLVILDLAGSERIHKSGSEGHMLEEAKSINLSLSALGKCINALAENSPHVPIRDSKLTRLLRDSFGGTARTSLIVTIGPSPRHRGETSSTILFGQRAMKVENMLKIKEEFDYKSLSRKLEVQLDRLTAENERLQKNLEDELERISLEAQNRISEAERNFADALEKERLKCQMDYMEAIKKLEEKLVLNHDQNGLVQDKHYREDSQVSVSEQVAEVTAQLQNEIQLRKAAEEEVGSLKYKLRLYMHPDDGEDSEILKLNNILEDEAHQKKKLAEEVVMLQSQLIQLTLEAVQMRNHIDKGGPGNGFAGLDSSMQQIGRARLKNNRNGHRPSVATLSEEVGLEKILAFLDSEDGNARIHAVKVLANLAAEDSNQKRIVEAGGLTSLLMLLRSYEDETIRRVAAGAIANLAMNEASQELIVSEGGITLLSFTANAAEDPQTLRMVAGAIANLCGNDKLQMKLKSEGGMKALLGMVRCGHADVLSQVARGVANFAKCESREATQSGKCYRSLLIEDGALPWIIQNANSEVSPIRRHLELALCHLAQHEVNAKEMISGGALWELIRISRDCSREDIKSLAHRTLSSSPSFRSEMKRLRIEC